MDGSGLKFLKKGPIYSRFDATCFKNPQEILLWLALSDKIHLISLS